MPCITSVVWLAWFLVLVVLLVLWLFGIVGSGHPCSVKQAAPFQVLANASSVLTIWSRPNRVGVAR